jgi:hypothetical protein
MKLIKITTFLFFIFTNLSFAQKILIYMDLKQSDHLKAYGVAYWVLQRGLNVEWLLNYRNGSFLFDYNAQAERELRLRGVGYEIANGAQVAQIMSTIEDNNMEIVLLEKAPKIAIYTPLSKHPWDDAVTLALAYAEIPYDKIYDEDVMKGKLDDYDWLHLHHEDFTGQYSKFHAAFSTAPWYIEDKIKS